MLYQELYSEIGKLLYAVADVDGVISEVEKEAIYEIVKKELVPVDAHKDEYGTDAAYYAEFEFEFLEEGKTMDVETAFNSFIDFVEDHKTALRPEIKNICVHVAEKVAKAYHDSNLKEAELIEKLKNKLSKI
jgi:uncharacterized tellurite resistance protein B-like protein